jgi:glucans biosynthesis protein
LPFRRPLAATVFVLLLSVVCLFSATAARAFGFDEVAERARAEAQKPYAPPANRLPAELAALSYDQYRDIRFREQHALWRREGLPFELMFFHLGKYFTEPVSLYEVTPQDGAHEIVFDPAQFDYGANRQLQPKRWGPIGYAGFKVVYPLNPGPHKDEVVVFLGASYFRALGAGQWYGLSARGLAIDTVGGQGEEFPRFKAFWIERPAPGADALTIYALLDSQRATGAYRFVVRPGKETTVDVQARLFLRAGVATLGIAPLTSMFHHGENDPRPGHFRPEVHDSDGLQLAVEQRGGHGVEWLWRPLINPRQPQVSSFQAERLRGFGLMQRDRAFGSYEDAEARYERRPSAWVEPLNDWGPGALQLLMLPTDDETNDNIVAYWVPSQPPRPGQPLDIAYRLHWQGDEWQHPSTGWTLQSRAGQGFKPLTQHEFQYVVDFAGPALDRLPAEADVKAVASAGPNGRVLEAIAHRNEATGHWRMSLKGQRLDPSQPLELRAFLQHGADALTETWTVLIAPE